MEGMEPRLLCGVTVVLNIAAFLSRYCRVVLGEGFGSTVNLKPKQFQISAFSELTNSDVNNNNNKNNFYLPHKLTYMQINYSNR